VSRTDKTKPWAIRVMEHRPWANHDHADGVCDLPVHYKDNAYYSTESGASHCRWSDWNLCYKDSCCYGCGCRRCTDQVNRKAKRRRERHQAQRVSRKAVTGLNDNPVLSRDRGW
jgi:hypothetical protein